MNHNKQFKPPHHLLLNFIVCNLQELQKIEHWAFNDKLIMPMLFFSLSILFAVTNLQDTLIIILHFVDFKMLY